MPGFQALCFVFGNGVRDGKGWGYKVIGACFEGCESCSDRICRFFLRDT